jgi:membrane-bound lytic murein transglycosylase
MKRLKKIIAIFSMSVLTTGLILTGCGQKIDPPEVTAEAFYNLYVLGDASKIENMGVEKSEYENTIEAERTAIKTATRTNFSKGGFTVSEDQLNRIADAQLASLKKLTPKIETSSTTDDTATVKIATTYVDIKSADTKAANDAQSEVIAMQLTSETEARKKFLDIYVNKIVENMNALQPSADTKEQTFTFKKQKFDVSGKAKDVWVPSDMTAFGTSIGKMITGQNA